MGGGDPTKKVEELLGGATELLAKAQAEGIDMDDPEGSIIEEWIELKESIAEIDRKQDLIMAGLVELKNAVTPKHQ